MFEVFDSQQALIAAKRKKGVVREKLGGVSGVPHRPTYLCFLKSLKPSTFVTPWRLILLRLRVRRRKTLIFRLFFFCQSKHYSLD